MGTEAMEKPAKLAPGQRWARSRRPAVTFVVEKRREQDDGWIVYFDGDERPFGDRYWFLDSQFRLDSTYLGMAAPPPAKGRGPMEALPDGGPARCLKCGGDKGARVYTCESCCFAMASTDEWNALTNSWERGSRDFPRSPMGAPGAAPGVVWQGSTDGETWCEMPQHKAVEYPKSREYVDGRLVAEFYRDATGRFRAATLNPRAPSQASAPVPVYGRMVGETRDANGVPLTALQAIQARKREPEPWPFLDESDLFFLRDA